MKKYFGFLNDLRESGIVNMFGAAPFLRKTYPELSKEESKKVLVAWMKSFDR